MKIRRIFWKLFFSFWLGNTLMLAGATVFILATVESSHFKERHQLMHETIASAIIEEYESGNKLQPKSWQRSLRHNPQFREFKHRFAMRILDESEKEVINIRFRNVLTGDSKKKIISFPLQSESNVNYRVETYKRPTPPFIREAMRRFNILQIIVVLFSSAFVAALLSWHLSRPLEMLRQFSKAYSGDSDTVEIDAPILARGDEIGDLARELKAMSSRVQKNFSNQKELLHYVSHELRAPLARLQTVAGLAESRVPAASDFIEKIHQECQNINALIESILQYSRLEHVALKLQDVKLNELMDGLVCSVLRSYPTANIQCKCADELAGFKISLDEDRIFHAMENILHNACKYGAQGEIITFGAFKENDMLVLCVENGGESIPPEALTRIFEPFYRVGNKMHTDGHGLGLSISKRAITQHGGELVAVNREQGGLKMTVTLPI